MKKGIFSLCIIFLAFVSCVSLTDRQIPILEMDTIEIIGEIETTFTSWQPLYIIRKKAIQTKAYTQLLEQAKMEYGNDVDIRNIKIKGAWSWHNLWAVGIPAGLGMNIGTISGKPEFNAVFGTPIIAAAGNVQKITASGNVVMTTDSSGDTSRPTRPRLPVNTTGIEGAVNRASRDLINDLPGNSRIAVISITSDNRDLSALVVDEIEFYLVSAKRFTIVDRLTLDAIRTEQNFQMSGDVSDASAVSIGQMLGANIVITGSISGIGTSQRLSIRALDVNTAQIAAMAREVF